MPSDSLNIVKNHLETNIGDLGILIFQKTVVKLNISANPSKNDLDNLIVSLENAVEKLYGSKRSKTIFENLRTELIECDKFFNKFFGSKIEDTLNNFFELKGIPRETEIMEIARFLLSNGYEQNEKKVIETLKKLTKERIIRDLKSSIINEEIKSFLDYSLVYSENDIENFIKKVKAKDPGASETELKDKIEKERLFRKFNYMERKENEEEKILKQYIAIFNYSLKKEYDYIVSDKDIISLMNKNHYLHLYFKRYSIDLKSM